MIRFLPFLLLGPVTGFFVYGAMRHWHASPALSGLYGLALVVVSFDLWVGGPLFVAFAAALTVR